MLYMKRGTPFLEQQSGGGQERQRRAGTENVAGIVGTAVALSEAQDPATSTQRRCGRLCGAADRGRAEGGARRGAHRPPEQRLPNNAHFSFEGAESDTMLAALDKLGIAASAGSACTSATWEPSHVLTAMGMPLSRAAGVLRLTCGPENTEEEIDCVLSVLPGVVAESRAKARPGLSAK